MLDHLVNLVSQLGHWGYLIIFLAVTLESAAFLGFLVPGEALVLLGGFLAAQGILDVGDLIALVCIGAVLGDSIGFALGRHLGRPWLLSHGRWIGLRPDRLARVDRFFERHGGKAVVIGRFSAFLRALTPFVAGGSGMRYPRFVFYNVIGGVAWSIIAVLLGYFLGASWTLVQRWAGPASAIVMAAIILLLVLTWLWRWLIRHEEGIRRRWQRFSEHPRTLAVRRKLAPQIAFLQARLSPGGYLGLHLTVGALILIAAAWLFGGIAQDVLAGDPLTAVDRHLALWLHDHTTPPVDEVMWAISFVGSLWLVGPLALVTAAALALRRSWFRLLALAVTLSGGLLLNTLLKLIFQRPRPPFASPLVHVTSSSFPSQHAVVTVLFWGFLAVLSFQVVRRWKWGVSALLFALLLVVLVGFSRMALGVHYLSDVLAGAAEGVAWLALCLTAVETYRRSRRASG
jgi:membrane protein DedA with SNARE-associated domain/membrane-associated phospholipid phosphatase